MELVAAPGWSHFSFSGISDVALKRLENARGCDSLLQPISMTPSEPEIVECALQTLKTVAVDFADLRLGRDLDRTFIVNDCNISTNFFSESSGIGIRALVNGFWGFSSTNDLSLAGVRRCAEKAVSLARATALAIHKDGALISIASPANQLIRPNTILPSAFARSPLRHLKCAHRFLNQHKSP